MGGFLLNGFGASEKYEPIRTVGTFYCPVCKKDREYAIMAANMKITLLFIPTVTVNTKYAIGCTACKNGYYIDEADKDAILYHNAGITVDETGVRIEKTDSRSLKTPSVHPQRIEDDISEQAMSKPDKLNDAADDMPISSQPEVESESETESVIQNRETDSMSESVISEVIRVERIVMQCPKCRLMFGSDSKLCPICGGELTQKN